jgi:hypothetical protein
MLSTASPAFVMRRAELPLDIRGRKSLSTFDAGGDYVWTGNPASALR